MAHKPTLGEVLLLGAAGAIAGTLGTILITRLLPAPSPGDGWTVRTILPDGSEKRVDFGEDEKAALQEAITLAPTAPSVAVIEIRNGRIVSIQPAGQAEKAVAA